MKKRIISLLVVLTMLCAFVPTTFAADGDLVSSVSYSEGIVKVKGSGAKNQAIDIFLLNPGKTVAELNNANTDALFDATVNYADVVYTDNSKLFETTFKVKDAKEDTEYVLYVKSESDEYTTTISEKNIYVAQDGNDTTGNGTKANPYATIQKAKEVVKGMPKTGQINVIIGGGEYRITEGLVFGANEAAKEGAPVIYKAAEGEDVVFNGSTKLDVSTFTSVSDAALKARFPEAARDKIVEIDLSNLPDNVVDFYTNHEAGKRISPMGVYLNGDRQELSQWPNSGYKTVTNVTAGKSLYGDDKERTEMSTFKISGLDAAKATAWAQSADDMFIDGYLEQTWYKESAKVASIDANGKFTLKEATYHSVKYTNDENLDTRVTVRNVPEEVDVPGEWYIDFSADKMYYYAPYTLTSEDTFEIATLTDPIIKVTGCDYTSFNGIEFTKCAGDAFAYNGTSNYENKATIENCKFTNIGLKAIGIGGTGLTFNNNVISNTGKQAMTIQVGQEKTLRQSNVVVSNNLISSTGIDVSTSQESCIQFWGGVGTVIKNNTIHDTPDAAVRSIGVDHVVKNNEIYNVVNGSVDAGAVYAGRSYVQYGFKVQNNYIHNVGSGHWIGGLHIAGVYLDDNFTGATVEGNIFDMGQTGYIKKPAYAVIATGGTDNTISGNIAVNAQIAYRITSRNTEEAIADGSHYSSEVFKTFLSATNGATDVMNITEDQWAEALVKKYPQIKTNYKAMTAEENPTIPRTTKVTNNVYNSVTYGVSEEKDGLIADKSGNEVTTSFVNVSKGDFRVKSGPEGTFTEDTELTTVGIQDTTLVESQKEFDLVYPANEAAIMDTTTYLTWQKSNFADEYTYKVYDNANLTGTAVATGTTKETFAQVSGLQVGKTYYWTVDATSKSRIIGGTYNCGETNSFKVTEYAFDAKYDAVGGRIAVKGVNNGAAKTVMMVAAVKVGTELKAVSMLTPNLNFVNGYNDTAYITVTDAMKNELATAGATLELYIWDTDMTALTGKIQF